MASPQAIESSKGNFFFTIGRMLDGRLEGVSSTHPTKYAGETPVNSAICSILSEGILVITPFSYLYSVCLETPILAARSTCVMPLFSRACLILSAMDAILFAS